MASDFDALQSRRHDDEVQLYAFDMLAGDGDDYSQNDGATISWSVDRLLEGFDMSRRPLLFCRGAILLAACRAAPAFNSPYRRSQTLRRDAALVSCPKEQATRPRVLLWVKFGSPGAQLGSPLYPQEQTSSGKPVRSEKCQEETPCLVRLWARMRSVIQLLRRRCRPRNQTLNS